MTLHGDIKVVTHFFGEKSCSVADYGEFRRFAYYNYKMQKKDCRDLLYRLRRAGVIRIDGRFRLSLA